MLIQQSTAITIKFGPFLNSADGNTVEAALTIQKADVRLSKNGGNMAAAIADQGVADAGAPYDELGFYDVSLDGTDTNTLGRLQVMVHDAAALSVWQDYMVVSANVYNSLVAGTDNLEVDAVAISGDSAAADNAELDYDGTGYAKPNSTIGTTTTNTDMVGTNNAALASVVGALADAAADGDPTNADTVMQYVKQLVNILAGSAGIVAFPAEQPPGNGVNLAEVIRAIHADVTGLNGDVMRGTDAAALAATALTDVTWTDARAGYLDELAAANLPTDIAALPTAAEVVDEWETQSQADPTGFHVNVLEIESVDATNQIRDSVLDDATRFSGADIDQSLSTTESNIRGADSDDLKDISDEVALLNDVSPAQVNAEVDQALVDIRLDHLVAVADADDPVDDSIIAKLAASDGDWSGFSEVTDSLEAISDAVGGVSAAVIADAVWDELLAGHAIVGSAGKKLSDLGGAFFPAGAIEYTYTVTDSDTGLPIEGVEVWFSTDLAGINIVWAGVTDAFGVARDVNLNLPWLDAGTYAVWKQRAGFIDNEGPDLEVVA